MPRSSRRLLDPQDHGSLEDVALHPQLGVLPLELHQTSTFIGGEALGLTPLDLVLLHPVAQRPRMDPKILSDLSDRLVGLPDDPHRPLTKLRVVLPTYLCHGITS